MRQTERWCADRRDGNYVNPVLYADYSDPDVIRVGKDYFMVASSFSNVPAIPVLHSYDLVNWRVIGYCMDRLPFDRYDQPQHGCGVWVPSIRYHSGLFYVCFSMPDEGIFMCTSRNPFQRWTDPVCIKKEKGWIDPCPFWDTDGSAYLVNAFSYGRSGRVSLLQITEMSSDGMSLIGESKIVFDGTMHQPVIEGPKLYRRNGYYYIFAAAGTVKTGWQSVLRGKNIYGPYEDRIVMMQCESQVNGPHQGGWVSTALGEDWFLHFQYAGNAGRIVHLQPMVWEHDWPVIGKNMGHGYGKPVKCFRKPKTEYVQDAPDAPCDSDRFDSDRLGMQWQWNANYKDSWYQLDKEKRQLRLYAQYHSSSHLYKIPNILVRKPTTPDFDVVTELETDELLDGDLAGVIAFGSRYAALAVECVHMLRRIVIISGDSVQQNMTPLTKYQDIRKIIVRMHMDLQSGDTKISYAINRTGKEIPCGLTLQVRHGEWIGVRTGLFAINTRRETAGGFLKVNYFTFQQEKKSDIIF